MPRVSKRQLIIARLDSIIDVVVKHVNLQRLFGIKVGQELLQLVHSCKDVQRRVKTNRYLQISRGVQKRRTPKFEELLGRTNTDDCLSNREFLFHFRVTEERFWAIVDLIKDHSAFQPKRQIGATFSTPRPAAHQLLVLLKYYGCQGNSGANLSLSRFFGVGGGTVENCCNNALEALLSLESNAYFWPDPDKRKEISKRIQQTYHFPNCVGFIDGTLLPLEFHPQLFGENYLSRKKFYAVTMLIVNDDNARILYYHIGWPGLVHDNRVWRTCLLTRKSDSYFAPNEYLLGDSAFTPGKTMVPAFKSAPGQCMGNNETAFNTLLARPRVKSEHCIGIMKGRFPFLKSIRMLIRRKEDMERIIKYVRGAVILHNILIAEPYDEEWIQTEPEDDNNQEETGSSLNEENNSRRQQLMEYLGEFIDINIY